MSRCFCACHEYPGTYPPPCNVCGHHNDHGRYPGAVNMGWVPDGEEVGPLCIDSGTKWRERAEYTEDCCFNYVRDHCQGTGCPCACHTPRSVMRSKHESDSAYLAWIEDADGGAVDLLRTHVVQAAFRGGWNAALAAKTGAMS